MVRRLAERAWDISARSTTLTKPSGYMITSARRSVTMRVFVFFVIVVGDDVAVVVEQGVVCGIEFADFVAFFEKIAGIAVVKILSWFQRLPAGYQNVVCMQKNPVILQKNAFFGNQTSAVQDGIFHKRLLLLWDAGTASVQGMPKV